MANNKENLGFIGYSNIFETPYILAPHITLPLTQLITGDLHFRYMEALKKYTDYCKKFKKSPRATTTYHAYVMHVRQYETPINAKRFINLHVMLAQTARNIAHEYASKKPPVAFVSVHRPPEDITVVKVRGTTQSIEARVIQSQVKDAITIMVMDDGRPVLDLGGGTEALKRSLKAAGDDSLDVLSVDLKISPTMDLNIYDYSLQSHRQFVSNHSTYHIHPARWLEILKYRPKGVTLSLPSSDDYQNYEGEDYLIEARRVTGFGDLEVFLVSGNIFSVRSNDGKGRKFTGEYWYSRKQWIRWGFSLLTCPHVKNKFLNDFFHGFYPPLKLIKELPLIVPECVKISQAISVSSISKKFPPIHQLMEEGDTTSLYQLNGVDLYHTYKIDGINMMLTNGPDNDLVLVDRRGCYYRLLDPGGGRFIVNCSEFRFSVELLPKMGFYDTFDMYLNQVVVPFPGKYHSVAHEIRENVRIFNKAVRQNALGQKPYKLANNALVYYDPPIPSDGAVYVPAFSNSRFFPKKFGGMQHCFAKPFEATDTNVFVMHSQVALMKTRNTPLEVFYRKETSEISEFQEDAVMKSMTGTHVSCMDFHDGSTISPLLYEGYHIPKGVLGPTDQFVVTHVRGDKVRQDTKIKRTHLPPSVRDGVYGFTRFAKKEKNKEKGEDLTPEVLRRFLNSLSNSRIVKMLPQHIGVTETYMSAFMADWNQKRNAGEFAPLTALLNGDVYDGPMDPLCDALRRCMPYMSTVFFFDILFRYPQVKRSIGLVGKKITVNVKFDISRSYEWSDQTLDIDGLGISNKVKRRMSYEIDLDL